MNEEKNECELIIKFEGNLSWLELREIMQTVDDHIFDELEYYLSNYYERGFLFPTRWPRLDIRGHYSFIEIKSVSNGSIIFAICLGLGVWTLAKIADGASDGKLGKELKRFGKNISDVLGSSMIGNKLESLNNKLENWSDRNEKLRKKKRKAVIRKKQD